MTEIFILGAGVMGSALSVPASADSGNKVTLVGSPLDDAWVSAVQETRHHPTLRADIPDAVNAIKLSELDTTALAKADVIVLGVSSPGIDWVVNLLNEARATPGLLALVTKGLVQNDDCTAPPLTYADSLVAALPRVEGRLVGIGGPCIARELALRIPTRVTFASRDISHANTLRDLLQTDYYRVTTHENVVAVEACAALKNFLCIGVSAMISAWPLDDSNAKNPVAALYNQAVHELLILSRWISHESNRRGAASSVDRTVADTMPAKEQAFSPLSEDVAFDLAGMGDLHVTIGGGRNSRLGTFLGMGRQLKEVIETDLVGVTVEGADTGRRLLPGFRAGCRSGSLPLTALPLTAAILECIEYDTPFDFDFTSLPG